jgi:hypothetical protein
MRLGQLRSFWPSNQTLLRSPSINCVMVPTPGALLIDSSCALYTLATDAWDQCVSLPERALDSFKRCHVGPPSPGHLPRAILAPWTKLTIRTRRRGCVSEIRAGVRDHILSCGCVTAFPYNRATLAITTPLPWSDCREQTERRERKKKAAAAINWCPSSSGTEGLSTSSRTWGSLADIELDGGTIGFIVGARPQELAGQAPSDIIEGETPPCSSRCLPSCLALFCARFCALVAAQGYGRPWLRRDWTLAFARLAGEVE